MPQNLGIFVHYWELSTTGKFYKMKIVGRQGFVHYWELFHYWGVHYSESIL